MLVEARRARLDHLNACRSLWKFRKSILTNANRLRGLLKFGESVLTAVKRAAGLYKHGVGFDNRKECRLLAKAGSVHF